MQIHRGVGNNSGYSAVEGVQWWSIDPEIAARYGDVTSAELHPKAKVLDLEGHGFHKPKAIKELTEFAKSRDIEFDPEEFQTMSGEEYFGQPGSPHELMDALRGHYDVIHTSNIEGPATMVINQKALLAVGGSAQPDRKPTSTATPPTPEARYTWYCDFLARAGIAPRPFDEWQALGPERYLAGNNRGWVAVDLDGTLARYDDRQGAFHIGEPVPEMVNRVRQWLADGREVRIFTARVYGPDAEQHRRAIEQWCRQYIGRTLPVTAQKDPGMYQFWDDRAIQVARNTGRPVGRFAQEGAPERYADPLPAPGPFDHETPSDPGYAYHATTLDRAEGIHHSGLQTHRPWHGTDQSEWPDRSTERRAYFTPVAAHAHSFTPEGGPPVLLRVPTDRHEFKREGTGDLYTTRPVHPRIIEALDQAGQWRPLRHFFAEPSRLLKQRPDTPERHSMTAAEVDDAVKDWQPPTEAQAKAENYRHPRVNLHGLTISIETPRGERRRPEWPPVAAHYGRILQTVGADDEHLDVFVADHPESELVYVVDQEHRGGRWDEHKAILGALNREEARRAYEDSYDDGRRATGITAMTVEQFKEWIKSGDTRHRIAPQVSRYTAEEAPEQYAARPAPAMNRYYRIQPAGKTSDHLSESSAGETTNLHVFESPLDTLHAQEHPTVYGDEVVELEAPRHWDNQDVEGVAIDPAKARVTRRWNLHDFPKAVYPFIANDVDELSRDVPLAYAEHPAWYIARNIEKHYGDLDARDRANERQMPADPERYAARHKPQAGQRTFHFESAAPTGARKWTAEQEAQHPRDEAGEFVEKEAPASDPKPKRPAGHEDQMVRHVANLHDAMQEQVGRGKQFLARHEGKPLWIPSGDHLRVSPDRQTIEHTDPQGRWVRADLAQLDHWAERANLQPFTGPEGILTTKENPDARPTPPGGRDRTSDRATPAAPDQRADDRPLGGDERAGPGAGPGVRESGAPKSASPAERLTGGRADQRPDSDFDPGALEDGIQHELEHTTDRKTASEIARDHLIQDPAYYQKLQIIEGDELTSREQPSAVFHKFAKSLYSCYLDNVESMHGKTV